MMDQINYEVMRAKMGMKRDILQEIEKRQLRRKGHIMRMEYCRIAGQVAEWNPQRKTSAATRSWKDGIRNSMQSRNCKGEEYFYRELWRKKNCLWVEENCVFTEKFL
jgi:hypothetical protein